MGAVGASELEHSRDTRWTMLKRRVCDGPITLVVGVVRGVKQALLIR